MKDPRAGLRRAEYDYEIPAVEAEEMLGTICDGLIIEKARFLVPHAGLTWEVGVHRAPCRGWCLPRLNSTRG